jgi:hypothetical protein
MAGLHDCCSGAVCLVWFPPQIPWRSPGDYQGKGWHAGADSARHPTWDPDSNPLRQVSKAHWTDVETEAGRAEERGTGPQSLLSGWESVSSHPLPKQEGRHSSSFQRNNAFASAHFTAGARGGWKQPFTL